MPPNAHHPDLHGKRDAKLSRPSLYSETQRLLARKGLPVPAEALMHDVSQPWQAMPKVQDLWEIVDRDPATHWQAYELAEKLMDIEDHFRRWRFNHVTTAERIIGFKRGTGGTSGVAYLRRMLDIQLFPELGSLRTNL